MKAKVEIRSTIGGDLDDIVARDVNLHLEQLDRDCWWLRIEDGNSAWIVSLTAKGGEITARLGEAFVKAAAARPRRRKRS